MTQINYYTNCFSPKEQKQVEIEEVIEIIKSKKLKPHTDYLRQEQNKEKRNEYKKNKLPAVTFQGTFYERSKDKVIKGSGFATIDIDDYSGDIQKIKQEIIQDPYVAYAFISPSGGLKVIVKIPQTDYDKSYKIIYFQLIEHYNKYNIKADEQTLDISRLCFLSYDPEIYSDENPQEFQVDWDNEIQQPKIKGSKIALSTVIN